MAEGFVSLDVACTDGTKMEVNANRYTFVWGANLYIPAYPESRNSLRRYGNTPTPSPSRNCVTPLRLPIRISPRRKWKSMYCPMGQRMERLSDARRVTNNGFVQTISRYKARNYKGCPLRCRCYRSRSERIVQVNHRLRKIKEREREKLLSDEGLKYRSQRPQDVEAVFGNLKNNKHFKRFHLRGLKKVEIEFGLLAIAHNLAKVAS